MRKAGVRTIFNLKQMGKNKEDLKKTAGLINKDSKDIKVPLEKLEIVHSIIEHDDDVRELECALKVLIGAEADSQGI